MLKTYVSKFRIQAMRLTEDNLEEAVTLINETEQNFQHATIDNGKLNIEEFGGDYQKAEAGDYLVIDQKNLWYVVWAGYFEAAYELA
jgi:hypothetical protein